MKGGYEAISRMTASGRAETISLSESPNSNIILAAKKITVLAQNSSFKPLAIPAQAFPSILLPVGHHPAFDMDAVDEVVVLGGEVGVAVDEGGVAVGA